MDVKRQRAKVFASVYDINIYRKEKRLTDVMVNRPIKYKNARLSSGEILEILLPDDGTVDDSLNVKVYSTGEVLSLPGHIVGNFIDCSSNIIGCGLRKSEQEIQSFTTDNCIQMNSHEPKNKHDSDFDYKQKTGHDSGFFDKTSSIGKNSYEEHGTSNLSDFENDSRTKIMANDTADDDKFNDNHNSCYISMTFNRSNPSNEISASLDSINASLDDLAFDGKNHDEEYVTVSSPSTPNKTSKEVNVPSFLVDKRYMSMKAPELPKRDKNISRHLSLQNQVHNRPVPIPNSDDQNSIDNQSLNLNILGVTEVIDLMSQLSLSFSQDKINSLNLDGEKLSHMSETQFHQIIGLSKFESRILYCYARGWRPTTDSKTNWREKKEMKCFSTMDLMTYLGYFGYAKISRYIYDYKVDGEMFMKLLEDELMLEIVFDNGTQLERYELDDLVIRFFHKRERTHRISKGDINKPS